MIVLYKPIYILVLIQPINNFVYINAFFFTTLFSLRFTI